MKHAGLWFFLSCKRYLKKISFLLILLILPAGTFFIRRTEKQEEQEIRIAVCIQGQELQSEEKEEPQTDSLERQLLSNLVGNGQKRKGSFFCFYSCDSEEQVKAEVASRRAECGYSISAGLRSRLDDKDYKRCIQVYSAPSTVLASLSTEVVFASLMELYGKEIFLDYVTQQQIVGEAALAAGYDSTSLETQAGQLYDKWKHNGSTFHFEYGYFDSKGQPADLETQNTAIFPVRGLVAVYLFVVGLYSAVMLGFDEKKGLFLPLRHGSRGICQGAALAAPVFLAALSGLAALFSGGAIENLGKEIGIMGAYVLANCVFAFGIKQICHKPQAVCCMIPLFLVGSLIFTPVFVDIGQFFPAWRWIGKLFLPFYYLKAF